MRKSSINPAVKSMVTLGLSLVLLIGVWAVIGGLLFPSQPDEDRYAAFIKNRGPLLEQVAQNAMDSNQWSGIRGLPEVQSMLVEGGIASVTAENGGVTFLLSGTETGERRILYRPDGEYVFDGLGDLSKWVGLETGGGSWRWTDAATGQRYVNVRRLGERFFFEERSPAQ